MELWLSLRIGFVSKKKRGFVGWYLEEYDVSKQVVMGSQFSKELEFADFAVLIYSWLERLD